MTMTRLPRGVCRQLRYYVYLYVNPLNNEVFYVGKGKGNRALSHLDGCGKAEHAKTIRKLRRSGVTPRVEILAHGFRSQKEAHAVETAAIDLIGLEGLANTVRGRRSRRYGRMPLEQVMSLYQSKPARIKEPVVLIRISRAYHYGMSDTELYDATRGIWLTGKRREQAKYAFAVYAGIVREVYQIATWLPAGSTFRSGYPHGQRKPGRWEFVGAVAPEKVRRKYVNRSVQEHIRERSQNPILYVNC
jgi:hypothetical protein